MKMKYASRTNIQKQTWSDGADTDLKKTSISSTNSWSIGTVVQSIVYLTYGIIVGLLTMRFILSLLAANRANGFADFIYSATSPFVSPFQSLFSIDTTIQGTTARFDTEAVIAIVVWGLVAWVIIRVARLSKSAVDEP